jgi:hypothetical protein
MNKEQQMEEQLWSYIDGSATAAEKSFVEKMLAAGEEWKAKYRELLELHQLLVKDTELEQPSLRFTKNVMDGIAGMQPKKATGSYVNKYIIRSIAAFFIITISALLVYAFTQVSWSSTGNGNIIADYFKKVKMPAMNFSIFYNSTLINSMIMILLVLVLMFFDRLLNRKKAVSRS